ncbi:MAG: HEAT repeat domain-containing protein [Myxococcales bacterium]
MTEPGVQPSACPLPLDVLPGNFQKHVDPAAPVTLRMMGAKALVPMGPKDMATALFMLTFDADAAVRETAVKSAGALADRILSVALRDENTDPKVLGFYAGALQGRPEYLEMLALNASTPDETIALIAATPNEKLTELLSQNQLRMLRHEPIVRALVTNPATRPVTIDNVTDFCVRSGLVLADLPAFAAARKRVLGSGVDEAAALAAAAAAQAEEAAAEQALLEMGASDAATEMIAETPEQEAAAEGKRLTIAQKVSKLSIAKKIEWANKKGNKEVRTILLRDPSKLVQLAVIQSPRITEGEIAKVALSRTAPGEVLQYIYNNRQLTKNYGIKVNLVNNPKVPVAVSMRYLSHLRSSELKGLSKNRNVSPALQTQARKLLEKKV